LQPGESGEIRREQHQPLTPATRENQQNHRVPAVPVLDSNNDDGGKMDNKMIDLNANPQRMPGQAPNNQVINTPKTIFVLSFVCFSLGDVCLLILLLVASVHYICICTIK